MLRKYLKQHNLHYRSLSLASIINSKGFAEALKCLSPKHPFPYFVISVELSIPSRKRCCVASPEHSHTSSSSKSQLSEDANERLSLPLSSLDAQQLFSHVARPYTKSERGNWTLRPLRCYPSLNAYASDEYIGPGFLRSDTSSSVQKTSSLSERFGKLLENGVPHFADVLGIKYLTIVT